MREKMKSTKGAVSVFLVIILVPCIVFTSIMVDLGRVKLARGVAESAGDLSMNTLLSNYDADLAEWYGVIASCQNIDQFYDATAKTFERMLKSQKLDSDEFYLLYEYYKDYVSDYKVSDFLQLEKKADTNVTVSGASIGENSLANPTLFKDAIVEFMKYRAPIEITSTLINRLNVDSASLHGALETSENKPLVDSKVDYYEAEGELLKAAFNTYWAIRSYFTDAAGINLTNTKLAGYASKVSRYKEAYSEIHKLLVKNLFNTSGLDAYNRVKFVLTDYNNIYSETSPEIYTRTAIVDGVTHYYINGTRIQSLLNGLTTAISDFDTSLNNFQNNSTVNSLMSKLPGDGQNDSYAIQWWVQMDAALRPLTSDLRQKADAMIRAYCKVLAIAKCELEENDATIPENWETESNTLKDETMQRFGNYLAHDISDNSQNHRYLEIVNKIKQISHDNIYKIKPSGVNVTVDGKEMTVSNAIPYIKGQLQSIKDELLPLIDELDIAINGNEKDHSVPKKDRVKSLDKLYELALKYRTALNNWSDTAENTHTDMGTEDREEIAKLNNEVASKITSESVNELKTRLTNIKTQLETITAGIDNMKYGNLSIAEIGNFDILKTQASSQVSSDRIGLMNGELDSYAASTFSSLFKPSSDPAVSVQHLDDYHYNVVILDPNAVDQTPYHTPELLLYLHEKFQKANKDDVQEAEQDKEDSEKEANEAGDKAKNKARYHGGGADIEKEFSGNTQFSLLDAGIGIAVEVIRSITEFNIDSMRDDLYVTAYIMNMFSYATYEEEGLYRLMPDDQKTKLHLPTGDKYRPDDYNQYMGSAEAEDNEGKWLSTELYDYYNKSLTNKLINKSNNSAYEAEVEYILFGKDNEANVKSMYSRLYALRYAMNVVAVFQLFWNGSDSNNPTAFTIDKVALAIQGLTQGVVPSQVTKAAILAFLAIFETAKDMDRLEAGFPVELYKTSMEQWWVRLPSANGGLKSIKSFLSTLTSSAGEPLTGPNQDKGLFYSDYLTLFVYLGLKGEHADDMYKRMAEVIQTNMRRTVGGKSYSMKKAKMYFTLNATIRVKPLMLTLPIFNEYEDDKPKTDDWCTFTVKTTRGYS